jgi:hypothetical protein
MRPTGGCWPGSIPTPRSSELRVVPVRARRRGGDPGCCVLRVAGGSGELSGVEDAARGVAHVLPDAQDASQRQPGSSDVMRVIHPGEYGGLHQVSNVQPHGRRTTRARPARGRTGSRTGQPFIVQWWSGNSRAMQLLVVSAHSRRACKWQPFAAVLAGSSALRIQISESSSSFARSPKIIE